MPNIFCLQLLKINILGTLDIKESNARFISVKDTYKPSCDYIEGCSYSYLLDVFSY